MGNRSARVRLSSIALLATLLPYTVSAATITVTSLANAGPGTLRSAIATAAANDTVDFSPGLTGRIDLLSTLTVAQSLVIRGNPGIVLDGGDAVRVLLVSQGVELSLSDLTIRRGFAGTEDGGGILNRGRLVVRNCIIEDNHAARGGALFAAGPYAISHSQLNGNSGTGSGGAIFDDSSSASTISDSKIRDNVTGGNGGGINHNSNSALTITRTEISGNQSVNTGTPLGGGIVSTNSPLTIRFSSITSNKAHFGGGLLAQAGSTSTLVRIEETLIAGNTAVSDGGGVFAFGSTVEFRNTTIANNIAALSSGGGMSIQNSSTSQAKVTLAHSTTAFNRASNVGAGVTLISGALVLQASLIADNAAPTNPDLQASFSSRGFNLIRTRGTSTGYVASDLANGTDPLLSGLAFQGGATLTAAIASGSPAAAAVSSSICENTVIDQRGYARPSDNCSIGAFDRAGIAPPAVLFADDFEG
jgi:fibronectin-binding autotransporter adhesin